MKTKNRTIVSPIRKRPLRRPGQSCREKVFSTIPLLLSLYIIPACICLGVFLGITLSNCFHIGVYYPLGLLLICAVLIPLFFVHLKKLKREMGKWILGLQGEIFVAEYLDNLKEKGCKILHDFIENGTNWNIDHLLISNQGIFTIETKTLSKIEEDRIEKIFYDGKSVKREKGFPIESPLKQAEAQAKQIFNFIKDNLDMEVMVQPIVVYPGWWVEGTSRYNKASHQVWICNPKYLDEFVTEGNEKLSTDDIQRIYNCLSEHIRNNNS